ncbi:DegT/DnrJ/EryC1/StrS family aminotransferase [Actinomyces qiguomingii]|uniref:DegT/DnrJ/EryC1/StrS family aminotransferase n=1 Tax=Actinomyces qiguomingii TaxID=2057800 RepID=UPI000CA040E0|nr:DegT/DnrJ/EryC1/StrS family aminotransferase [Actinomyces qiguomingii]
MTDAMTGVDSRFPQLRAELARLSDTDAQDWYPVFKARYGMQVVLEQLHALRGDGDVLTQLFTCCTAVVPIIAAGLSPRYADIDADTLALTPGACDQSPTPAAEGRGSALRGVIIQHTFGIQAERESADLARRARAAGALVMEDAAHCVARLARADELQPLADVSFHSFGVQKILPTHFGGAVWVNPALGSRDPGLDSALRAALAGLPPLSPRLDAASRMYRNQARVLARVPQAVSSPARAAASRLGLLDPPVARAEQGGQLPYAPMAPSQWVAGRATAALHELTAANTARIRIVNSFRQTLPELPGVSVPGAVIGGEPEPLLRFPLLLPDTAQAEHLITAMRAIGVFAERWGRPLLYPGVDGKTALKAFRVPPEGLPVTHDVSARVVALPTELDNDRAARAVRLAQEWSRHRG